MMKRLLIITFLCFFTGTLCQGQVKRNMNIILRSNYGTDTLHDGVVVKIYGLTWKLNEFPQLPAKTIYANEGDTVVINAQNVSQGEHHTIHLHGLDVDTRNDGDPATSFELGHMQDTTYTFIAHHAGTYIYHCHVADVVHVQMGMYGLIAVRAKNGVNTAWTNGPAFNKSYSWLTSEVDRKWHDSVPIHDTFDQTVKIPPYKPEYFLVNGHAQQELLADDSTRILAETGQAVYVRLANIGFYTNEVVFPPGMNATIIDSDGRPLPATLRSDTVYVAPGERYGVMLTPATELHSVIAVNYVDMNTGLVRHTENVPVDIVPANGFDDREENGSSILLYPNPADNVITVELQSGSLHAPGKLELVNSLGQSVYSGLTNNKKSQVDLRNLPAGIYVLRLEVEKSTVSRKLLIAR